MADQDASWIPGLVEPLRVKPGSKVRLAKDFDPGTRFGVHKKKDGLELLRRGVEMLAEYQDRLGAQNTYGVLVVLQALDAAGKDSTIRHVMTALTGGTQSRLLVAARPPPACPWRDRDLQQVARQNLRPRRRRERPGTRRRNRDEDYRGGLM
jgi:hypothetical protein